MINILKEIETKYPVSEIRVNGEQVWPYLRIAYLSGYRAGELRRRGERTSYNRQSRVANLLRLLRAGLNGIPDWFRKHDYVALAPSNDRRPVGPSEFNRLLDPIIDELGADRVLLIESPAPKHYPSRRIHTRHVVSSSLLTLVAMVLQRARRKRLHIERVELLHEIGRQYGLEVDHLRVIQSFETRRRLLALTFRWIRPKLLIVSDYYDGLHQAAVKAAHEIGIKVIEVQHGVIGREHPAYNVNTDLDRSFFPDHLLVFGSSELETFANSRFMDPGNVHPIGSFYIDHVKAAHKPDSALVERLSRYKRSVGVTLQLGSEKRVVTFVCQAASLHAGILYVIIPRRIDNYLSSLALPQNVTVIEDRNFYEMMMYVDFHSTLTSTCALEAPSLGVQNILLNIDNQAKRYYGTVLADARVTRFVDTPEEYVETVLTLPRLNRETVCQINEPIIASDYERNLREVLRKHLQLWTDGG